MESRPLYLSVLGQDTSVGYRERWMSHFYDWLTICVVCYNMMLF